ncbi:high mobility group box domain-containing protein, partial [Vararia minispora EC-137]
RPGSVSLSDDRDATVRRKRKADDTDAPPIDDPPASPQRSHLRPPKLAPSTWQLWFADWIQRQQATSDRKLNVAQAAKEAGAEYARLSPEEKEPYARRSQQLKDIREREHAQWMQSLSPDDIKRENSFRAAQRKAGKSRKGNIKDPNAPKKPLSAYFNFIQSIRADPDRVRDVFGDETETTRQSVLAAQKWRSMSDEEKRPFLAQAEHDRLEYEAAKKLYDEATTGHTSGVSFSVL